MKHKKYDGAPLYKNIQTNKFGEENNWPTPISM
jgi:hypothetical protein